MHLCMNEVDEGCLATFINIIHTHVNATQSSIYHIEWKAPFCTPSAWRTLFVQKLIQATKFSRSTNNNWYDVMSFSLINIDTMFFRGFFDSRVNMHLLPSDCMSNIKRWI